ncbi:MAG: hypothetical protein U5R31_05630 [Acidimicrobiia bacterium]|nr:hypothetical protein [Acidimicrobiia bacterium]
MNEMIGRIRGKIGVFGIWNKGACYDDRAHVVAALWTFTSGSTFNGGVPDDEVVRG